MATRENSEDFERMLSCLVDANQTWAKNAPVLVLTVAALRFKRNGEENSSAIHDMGLASANLTVEATARGLAVHQMAGIIPDKAKELYHVPDGYQVVTAMAIGYAADPDQLPEKFKQRDLAPRTRRPQKEFVFEGRWGISKG